MTPHPPSLADHVHEHALLIRRIERLGELAADNPARRQRKEIATELYSLAIHAAAARRRIAKLQRKE